MQVLSAVQSDERLRRNITTAYLPYRKEIYIDDSDDDGGAVYQNDILDKFEIYSQRNKNRNSLLSGKSNRFTAIDFFVSQTKIPRGIDKN